MQGFGVYASEEPLTAMRYSTLVPGWSQQQLYIIGLRCLPGIEKSDKNYFDNDDWEDYDSIRSIAPESIVVLRTSEQCLVLLNSTYFHPSLVMFLKFGIRIIQRGNSFPRSRGQWEVVRLRKG